jgi:hypothetical protein
MKTRALYITLTLAFVVSVVAAPVNALTITINDLTDDVTATSDSNTTRFEFTGGNLGESSIGIFDQAFTTLQSPKDIILIEPGQDTMGTDVISSDFFTHVFPFDELIFVSDVTTDRVNCSVVSVRTCITETGTEQNVADLLFGPNSGITINVTSDIDEVPEPATFPLLAASLLGLVFLRSRFAYH